MKDSRKIDAVDLGTRIRSLRTARGLTQREFADRLGIHQGHVAKIETGKANASTDLILSIAREFDSLELAELIGVGLSIPIATNEKWHTMSLVIGSIVTELNAAEKQHPKWPEDRIHQAGIVAEESGELMKAAVDYVYFGGTREGIRREAIQTAAMAIRLLMNLGGDKK